MKIRNFTFKFSVIVFFITTLLSCKKYQTGLDEKTQLLENETNNWFLSVKTGLSGLVLQKTNAKVQNLDFSYAKIIEQKKSGTLFFFVRVKEKDAKRNEYLSFAKVGDKYQTVGLVKVLPANFENELGNIEKFINEGKLDDKFRLSFYRLNNRHIVSYEGVKDGLKKLVISNIEQTKNARAGTMKAQGKVLSCTDWYIVTTYTNADGSQYQTEQYVGTTCEGENCQTNDPFIGTVECVNPGEGGGSAGGNSSTDCPDDGKLSCGSFQFTRMTANMYEAGTSGLMFVMDIAGGGAIVHNFRTVYVGFPSNTANGTHFSAGKAAAITAYAMNRAGSTMHTAYLGMSTTQASTFSTHILENQFKTLVKQYINQEINAGSTADFTRHGPNTVTRPAEWNNAYDQFWNGLTGNGCQ